MRAKLVRLSATRAGHYSCDFLALSALVSFERARLLEQLNAPRDGSPYIDAQFVHFVALSHALTEAQSTTLAALLDYGERGNDLEFPAFVVVPRPGTLSPWSSKATDIARGCGLDAVTRIERGVAWSVSVWTRMLSNV